MSINLNEIQVSLNVTLKNENIRQFESRNEEKKNNQIEELLQNIDSRSEIFSKLQESCA